VEPVGPGIGVVGRRSLSHGSASADIAGSAGSSCGTPAARLGERRKSDSHPKIAVALDSPRDQEHSSREEVESHTPSAQAALQQQPALNFHDSGDEAVLVSGGSSKPKSPEGEKQLPVNARKFDPRLMEYGNRRETGREGRADSETYESTMDDEYDILSLDDFAADESRDLTDVEESYSNAGLVADEADEARPQSDDEDEDMDSFFSRNPFADEESGDPKPKVVWADMQVFLVAFFFYD
jgi:hypothetical protein